MYVRKISLKITCLLIAAIGLLGTVSTLNLMKNNIPATFAQPMTTATNSTQGMLTTSQASAAGADPNITKNDGSYADGQAMATKAKRQIVLAMGSNRR
jgi:hypothetical protein